MRDTRLAAALAAVLTLGLPATSAATVVGTQILYDGSLATAPGTQNWFSFVPMPAASQELSGGAVTLDTTLAGNGAQAGYSRAPLFGNAVMLDANAGFLLSFTAKVETESHANDDRAGFSVIVLDTMHNGVELGFWTDRVFAYDLVGGSFVQAAAPERVSRDTTSSSTYSLAFSIAGYTLSADGAPLFSGPLRDYSPSGASVFGFPVYAQNNFLFLGDDTSSAAARWSLQSISVAPIPEPSQAAMLLTGLVVIGFALRRRDSAPA